ncbi:hypothetical protein GPECTOR_7g1063 [Gonium pectorale]|uniref:Hemerythrin-like domain-containing protein n=1 Tax=Gonium pectorale TaxID=33097 RepID=A0A150GTM5_GONPE|nr:hypothetical protein GPECTOR_7g1063 [Gonium pectorale]|eukprot:KXZ53171.1 hypothetical protein GPECTOR_7g1063 [Gonium pectorale]
MATTGVGSAVEVAGITLEYTSLEHALKALGMDQQTLEKHMATSAAWPFPGHLDGWKVSHNAIRFDMENMLAAIVKTKAQVDGGKPLAEWQVEAFKVVMGDLHHTVHKHHDHEEEIFFPWMESRFKVPEKMGTDHKTIMSLLDKCRELTGSLKSSNNAEAQSVLSDLHTVFTQLRHLMRQHLEEEEIVGLPLLRKHFNAKELAKVEKKIIASMKPSDVAWVLRPLSPAGKKETMTRLNIPGLVQRLVFLPAIAKDDCTIIHAYKELAAGERLPLPGRKKGFMCFSA